MAIADSRTNGGNGVGLRGHCEGPGSRAHDGRIKGRDVRAIGGERVQRVSDGIGDVRHQSAPREFLEQSDRIDLFAMCTNQQ